MNEWNLDKVNLVKFDDARWFGFRYMPIFTNTPVRPCIPNF